MEHNEEKEQKLASTKKLITFANIAALVSLIIGGVALSTAALICAIIARSRINKLIRMEPRDDQFVHTVMQAAKPGAVALVISAIALVLNAISVAIVLPTLMEAMNTGDLQTLLGGSAAGAAGSATSTWG